MWVIDGLVTVLLAVCSATVAEGIIWLMMYRTQRYIKLNRDIEKQSKKVMQLKKSGNPDIDENLEEKIAKEEERLTTNIKEKISIQSRSASVAWTAIIVLLVISNILSGGKVAAKIPFLPSWIQGVIYRNLPGNGYYNLAYVFVYLLCLLWLRCKFKIVLALKLLLLLLQEGLQKPLLQRRSPLPNSPDVYVLL